MFILLCVFGSYASFLFESSEESKKWQGLFRGEPFDGEYPIPTGIRNRVGPEKRSNVLPDFTHIGLKPIPTFSERAVHALRDILETHGELAPIQMDEPMRYYGFNPTVIVENLVDLEKSEVEYFPTGRVMAIDHYVLRPGAEQLPWIFKIPETRRGYTYVNANFVARVEQEKLTGFKFVPLP